MVTHAYNPTTQEVDMGGSWLETSLNKSLKELISKNKLGVVVHICIPS
jgi:hypothetical protein